MVKMCGQARTLSTTGERQKLLACLAALAGFIIAVSLRNDRRNCGLAFFEGHQDELSLFGGFEDKYNGTYNGWKYWCMFIERLKVPAPEKEIGIYTA
ncbi:MAG: hypothetical protein Q8O48_01575 [Anaerolineales bacterium]|nr:hypothetical protein [Anaerolineales bacterium]